MLLPRINVLLIFIPLFVFVISIPALQCHATSNESSLETADDLETLASKGDPGAQYELMDDYMIGYIIEGDPEDLRNGLELINKAAE